MKQQEEYIRYQKEKEKRETWMSEMRQRASVYINPALGRLIRSKEKYIEREVYAHAVEKVQTDKQIVLSAAGGTHQGKLILDMKNQSIGFDDTILINKVSMEIRGKERIRIEGPNGSGKTTLIKHIISLFAQENHDDTIKIGNNISYDYFDQHNEILQSQEPVYSWFAKNLKTKTDERGIRSQLAIIGLSQSEIA